MAKERLRDNRSVRSILLNMLLAAVSLFFNGFGVYLTIQANIGAGPWDVLNLGIAKTFGILYGSASIAVSLTILVIDILLKEPIGIAMFIDAVVVGKAVDFFNYIDAVPARTSLWAGVPVMLMGLVIMAYTQYTYMIASLGCGPRDTLLVGLAKRVKRIPIGAVSIALLSTATLIGWLLGGVAVIEIVFSWPGIGNTAVRAIMMRDYPLIEGFVLWIAIVYMLINFLVDLSYAYLDPKLRRGESG